MIDAELRNSSAHVFVDDVHAPTLTDADRHHLAAVLRLRSGESVSITDGGGLWRLATWTGHERAPLDELQAVRSVRPLSAPIELLMGAVKADQNEWAVQKLVELGVDRIVVFGADHSSIRWDAHKREQIAERFRRIGLAAASQARRVFRPAIDVADSLSSAIGDARPRPVVALAEPGGRSLADLDGCFGAQAPPMVFAVGPAGGWSATELAQADDLLDLGDTVLRAETAAVVLASGVVALRRSQT